MKGSREFESYVRVPGGSTLSVTLGGDQGTYNADAQLVSSSDVTSIIPGPGQAVLAPQRQYFVRIRIAFLTDGMATVRIVITKPAGDVHGEKTEWTIQGANGTVEIRGCFVQTV